MPVTLSWKGVIGDQRGDLRGDGFGFVGDSGRILGEVEPLTRYGPKGGAALRETV